MAERRARHLATKTAPRSEAPTECRLALQTGPKMGHHSAAMRERRLDVQMEHHLETLKVVRTAAEVAPLSEIPCMFRKKGRMQFLQIGRRFQFLCIGYLVSGLPNRSSCFWRRV